MHTERRGARAEIEMALLRLRLLQLVPALLGRAAAQVPALEELGSDWVAFGTGATVPTGHGGSLPIPIDCPSISNTAGSVGSCEPGCPDLLSFNSWTAGPYLQGTCAARVRLDGVPVNVTRHRWLPYEVTREGTAGRFSFTSSMRMLDDGAGTPGVLLNLTVTPTSAAVGQQMQTAAAAAELTLNLAPELQLLSDMPWNINWPPKKAGWTHTVEGGRGRLMLSSDTTTAAVAALGIVEVVSPDGSLPPVNILAPTQHSVGLGALGPAASLSIPLPTLSMSAAAGAGAAAAAAGQGGATTLTMFVVAGNSSAAALAAAASLSTSEGFASAWSASRDRWASRWRESFQPKNAHCASI